MRSSTPDPGPRWLHDNPRRPQIGARMGLLGVSQRKLEQSARTECVLRCKGREGVSQSTATGTSRGSGTRPRSPTDRGIRQANAPGLSGLSRGLGPRAVPTSRKYSSSQHVAAPAGTIIFWCAWLTTPSNYGGGLALSPASVAKSAASAASKPPSPPPSTAPSRVGGMAAVAWRLS